MNPCFSADHSLQARKGLGPERRWGTSGNGVHVCRILAVVGWLWIVGASSLWGQLCESWNEASRANCWFFRNQQSGTELKLPRRANRGVDDSGHVFCHLDQVTSWKVTGSSVFYPLETHDSGNCGITAQQDFREFNRIAIHLNIGPFSAPGTLEPGLADLKGGQLRFWVGEYLDPESYTFYYFHAQAFVAPVDLGWRQTVVNLSQDSRDWTLMASAGPARPIEELLVNPWQWGIALVYDSPEHGSIGTEPELRPTGWLGFDELIISRRFAGETWLAEDQTRVWFAYTGGDLGSEVIWMPEVGVHHSGFAYANLSDLVDDPILPADPLFYYPVFTLGWLDWLDMPLVHTVDLTVTDQVSFYLNAKPLESFGPSFSAAADLRGGSLRFWVGQFNSETLYSFYYFQGASLDPGTGGWVQHTIALTSRPEDWVRFISSDPSIPLERILENPQQWGLAIVGAQAQPGAWLGFDQLRIYRRFEGEDWNTPSDGWFAYTGGSNGAPIRWLADQGEDNTGFVYVGLDELAKDPALPAATQAWYPLYTMGGGEGTVLHPVDFVEHNRVQVALNAMALGHRGPPYTVPADLKGGQLQFWVGERNAENQSTFYTFTAGTLAIGAGGWIAQGITLSTKETDWEAFLVQGERLPLLELLRDPQQWGLGIFHGSSQPSGWLGIDQLGFQGPRLEIQRSGDTIMLSGDGGPGFWLQSAPSLTGPWTDQEQVEESPFQMHLKPENKVRYFRLRTGVSQ